VPSLAQELYETYWQARGEPCTLWENLSPESQAPWVRVTAVIYDRAMKSAYRDVTSAAAQQCARLARLQGAPGVADSITSRYVSAPELQTPG